MQGINRPVIVASVFKDRCLHQPHLPAPDLVLQALGLYERARRIAAEIGFELANGQHGGGSDGNFTGAMGVATLDGLGVMGSAVIYRYRTGIPWRDLPERYGEGKAVHKRFRRWCE